MTSPRDDKTPEERERREAALRDVAARAGVIVHRMLVAYRERAADGAPDLDPKVTAEDPDAAPGS